MGIHWKDWCWSWSSSILVTWCEKLIHWKRSWCWERLKARGEGGDRGWDGWMASWLTGHEFEQTQGDSEAQGNLICCSSWGQRESDLAPKKTTAGLPRLFFFSFIFISWRLITLQYCSGFCHTLTWISHGFTCVPHHNSPSDLPLHPIRLGLPSAPALHESRLFLLIVERVGTLVLLLILEEMFQFFTTEPNVCCSYVMCPLLLWGRFPLCPISRECFFKAWMVVEFCWRLFLHLLWWSNGFHPSIC